MGEEACVVTDGFRCRSARFCVARCGVDAAATSKQGTLCHACIESVQHCRDGLPAVRDAVHVWVGINPVTVSESKVSSTKEPSSPLNLAADTILSDIDEVLSRVGNYLVRDLVCRPAERFKAWRSGVEQYVYWDGVDLALQIVAVYRRAMKLLGFERQWQRRAARCWSCGLPTLGQFTGSETVECSACGERKSLADYTNYCLSLVKGK